ncbi:glycoside hydrolase family 17 [Dyella sp. A6]|uniref:glycoside hydrolase family 17 protein n=1 Tax=Dyella aluminiiresistens TaxID=3069105 RepID=UPI002E79405F|nr:glycoside hydrolase family 17 [Dyella sp. A6]
MSPSPVNPSRQAMRLAWLLLVLAAAAGLAWWWSLGRPVMLPDAPSTRIACVSYAPYRLPGETPYDPHAFISPARIAADLRVLSQRFDCVRTYSQGQGLSAVPAIAQRYGMKVLMGIWLDADARANAREIALGIANARAHPDVLRGVIVGNEVLLRTELAPKVLARYIRQVRAAIPASVPVSYADVWEDWLRYPQMARAVDYLTIHILPYWENDPVSPEHAVRHVADVYARIQRAFPGKRVMIGETGWPSEGRPRGAAVPSVVNEARYLREFLAYAAKVKMPYNVIEAFDQPWKRVQEGTVGGYWGIFDAHARPKFPMRGPVTEDPDWWLGWLAAAAGALLFTLSAGRRRDWHGMRGWAALVLAGLAGGCALAWQARQMIYACVDGWDWLLAGVAWLLSLLTGVLLAQSLASGLAGMRSPHPPGAGWRFVWLFGLAFYSLLEVFDGRYRDFPLGLFALPCVGYLLLALLRPVAARPSLEQRFLGLAVVVLGAIMVLQSLGQNVSTWLWLGLCLAIALPVLQDCRTSRLES